MTFQEKELHRLVFPEAHQLASTAVKSPVSRRNVLRGTAAGLGVGAAMAMGPSAASAAETPRVLGFNSTGVTVRNIEKSLHFYVDLVGYTLIGGPTKGKSEILDRLLDLDKAVYRIATVRPPGTLTDGRHRVFTELIEIVKPATPPNQKPKQLYTGRTHTGIFVEDIFDLFDRLSAAGVRAYSDSVIVNVAGTLGVAYMLDPDDAIWEILGPVTQP